MFAFLDGEVSVERNLEVLQHVNGCAPCARRFEAEKRFEEGLDRNLAAGSPPAGLRARLDEALDRAVAEEEREGGAIAPAPAVLPGSFPGPRRAPVLAGRWRTVAAAAAALLAAVLVVDRLCIGPFQCPVLVAATEAAAGLEDGRGTGGQAALADAPDLAAAGWTKVGGSASVPAPRLQMTAAAAEYASGRDRVALVALRIGAHDPKSWNRKKDEAGREWYEATVGARRVLGWKEDGVFRALVTTSPRADLAALARLVRTK